MSYEKEGLFMRVLYFFSGGGGRTAKEDGKLENRTNYKCMALCVHVLAGRSWRVGYVAVEVLLCTILS
jgi:hypothetical protein